MESHSGITRAKTPEVRMSFLSGKRQNVQSVTTFDELGPPLIYDETDNTLC